MAVNLNKYYDILGLGSGANQEEIKKARDRLAKKYHPDRNRGKEEWAKEQFQKIQEAFEILTGKRTPEGQTIPDEPQSELWECDRCKKKFTVYGYYLKNWPFTKTSESKGKLYFCDEKCQNNYICCAKCGKDEGEVGNYRKIREIGHIVCVDCWKTGFTKCDFCSKNIYVWVFSFTGHSEKFCSDKCRSDWPKKNDREEELKRFQTQVHDFIENKLKNLTGWNLLSKEEKENFIEQVNNSESEEFENILRQAKKLIREKQSLSNRGRENKKNNPGENDISDSESDSGYDSNQSHESESREEIPNLLSLAQSQAKAEQEVAKIIKDNSISKKEEELLEKAICSGENWNDYIKKLDTPAKIEEFINKVKQFVLKNKLARPNSNSQDKSPKNGWVLPIIISVVSFLTLTSLVLIIRRRRKQRGF